MGGWLKAGTEYTIEDEIEAKKDSRKNGKQSVLLHHFRCPKKKYFAGLMSFRFSNISPINEFIGVAP